MVEQIENEGFENYTVHKQIHIERQIDYLNTIKLLHLVKDDMGTWSGRSSARRTIIMSSNPSAASYILGM